MTSILFTVSCYMPEQVATLPLWAVKLSLSPVKLWEIPISCFEYLHFCCTYWLFNWKMSLIFLQFLGFWGPKKVVKCEACRSSVDSCFWRPPLSCVRWQVEACIVSLNHQFCWSFTLRTPDIAMSRCSLPTPRTCCIWHARWKTHCANWTLRTVGVFYATSDA